MIKMEQNRIKSKVVWGTLAAQILSILVLLEVFTPTQSEVINQVVGAVLQLLVVYGVLNNPTSATTF